jgi:hypothetical protein
MTTLTVGPGEKYPTIAAAVAVSQDGDVIEVAAGDYPNDFLVITTNITIEGVGGMVNIVASVPPPDAKAIVTTEDADVTLINIALSGAAVSDANGGNGAGIRYQGGGNLTLDHVYIHDNQEGLLADASPTGTITITNSEFANNGSDSGAGFGLTHNIYIGAIATFTITDSYIHNAVVGHEIKSRAANNIIENNRIVNGPTGTGSYEIDLPNGGDATILNNVIEKGPDAQNPYFISYGEEVNTSGTVSVAGNTIINDDPEAIAVFHDFTGSASSISITGNSTFGLTSSQIYSGSGIPVISGNTILPSEPAIDTSSPFLPPLVFMFPCFAAGTHILTDMGEVVVEQLQVGDRVATMRDGEYRPIKWIGHRRINLTAHPAPRTVRPVRVARDAIANHVPHRDLLLSPDHAVHIGGMLIGARQLINGMSIGQDAIMTAVHYYHVELASHDILLSEGLTTESYLDTGNSGVFDNSLAPMMLHPDFTEVLRTRFTGSCAPFHVDEPAVKPVWQFLAERAKLLGYAAVACGTNVPDFRIVAGNRTMATVRVEQQRYTFIIPHNVNEVRLLSRAALPTECRPWLDDHRTLGVSISRIVFHARDGVVDMPMDHPTLTDGWWPMECQGESLIRWTNGDARLTFPGDLNGQLILEIQVAGDMIYPANRTRSDVDFATRVA